MSETPVVRRFLNYVAIPTMSAEDMPGIPSTKKQFALAEYLVRELKELGLEDASVDAHGYVYATLPGTVPAGEDHPVIGLIAHMDTSPEAPDEPVRPSVRLYEGRPVCLNEGLGLYLDEAQYPELGSYAGKHLIVTDGTTLLGGDDKAGIAEILTALEQIISKNVSHRTIKVAFTPDEEVGRGAELFDIERFGADFAYTVDGGRMGELEYENFNAASADLVFHGVNVHPGSAKNKMRSSMLYAQEFMGALPADETPATTEGYEGYYHLLSIQGSVEETKLHYIIRDFDKAGFENRKAFMTGLADRINREYGAGTAEISVRDSYFNMREVMEQHMDVVERAKQACRSCGVEPLIQPIRGGTDGATLSLRGLPCPNLGTADNNAHSRFEYVCAEDMQTITAILEHLLLD